MTSRIGRGVAAAGVLVALAAAPLRGQQLRYTGSIGWASGSYTFTERTESFTLLNGLALAGERWSFSVTQPIVIQNTGSVTYVGGMQIPTGAGRQTGGHQQPGMGGTASGGYETVFGDPILRASVTPQRGGLGTPSLELQIMAKAPVADPATGVGTGEWDTGAGVTTAVGVGLTFLFADVAVWSPGDMPDLELQTYGSLALGVGRPLGGGWSGLASLTVASAMIDGLAAPAALGGGLSHRLGEGGSLSVGGSVGLTESAPDLAIYLGWSASP